MTPLTHDQQQMYDAIREFALRRLVAETETTTEPAEELEAVTA